MQTPLPAHCVNKAHTANIAGEYNIAVKLCKQALKLAPTMPEAWYNLSIALVGLGKRSEAIHALEKTRSYAANSADAQNSIGLQFIQLDAYPEAEQCLMRALALKPDYAFAHSNLGKLRERQKRFKDAEASIRKAIQLQPGLAPMHANLGAILNAQLNYSAAETACHQAITLDAQSPEAWCNLGSALFGLKRHEEAEAACRTAVKLDAKSPEAWCNLGSALHGLKQYQEAAECLSKGLKLNPAADFLLGELFHTRMKICDWQSFANDLSRIVKKIEQGKNAANPFIVLAITGDLALQRQAAETWAKVKAPEQLNLGSIPKRCRGNKIRIGYYSADYSNHATTYLMAELFELHNKDNFELIGFSFGPDNNDAMRKRVVAAFDQFIDVREKSGKAIAQLSREMGIDIAVDLKGYTEDCRSDIFSYRAAPIQVNYLGYPGTMGVNYIDYIVADPVLIPAKNQHYYSEKIAYLPNSYQVNDARRKISERIFTREELGLPDNAFVFSCFNNNHKIIPSTFNSWMRILKQVDNSVLWLFEENPTVAENLRKEAQVRGIDPSRLIFAKRMPLEEHLARHRVADLFIDTLPYNAHTTASDALWAGLPVLTCLGEAFASRVAASLLNAVGLPELVCANQEGFEKLAVELATHPEQLAHIKQKLEQNKLTAPLFDTPLFTKNIEQLYVEMFERYLSGNQPEHLYVESRN